MKNTYRYILERIESKLSSWKARTLSLASRVTLALSVLNVIHVYAMKTFVLLMSVCDAIDRKIRNFVWGGTDEKRKVHLISWDQIYKPKGLGGLGLKPARSLNQAFMVKLAWEIFNYGDSFWV
ncbi:unnamed protein product [Linum trigynum]|uniref:Uncharacterized protein n=1 Tax=Linum trigynum TaxID=586398 RepID=A0AAV2EDG3_9ROSI